MITSAYGARLAAFMPAQEAMTLYVRGIGEGDYLGVPAANVRRLPASIDDLAMSGASVGQTVARFEIYNSNNLPLFPKVGDYLQDGDGFNFQIRAVDKRFFGTVASCVCVQDKSITLTNILTTTDLLVDQDGLTFLVDQNGTTLLVDE